MMKHRKIGVIGIGHVGSHVASSLVLTGVADELILIDIDEKKGMAHARDIADMAAYSPAGTKVSFGDYKDLADADIVVMSASGPIFKEDRLEELFGCAEVVDEVAPKLTGCGFSGIVLSISNPCDIIAHYMAERSGLTVLGTGTALDSARLKVTLGGILGVSAQSIHGYCLGEHGDSQSVPLSIISVGGQPLLSYLKEHPEITFDYEVFKQEVVSAGWQILLGKGSTEFGIGATAAQLCGSILSDEAKVLPCSTLLTGQFGESGIYASLPCIVDSTGVREILIPELEEDEIAAFRESASAIKKHTKMLFSEKLQ